MGVRFVSLALALACLVACSPELPHGPFQQAGWRLVGSVTPDASEVVIDVHAESCPEGAIVKADVAYGTADITISTDMALPEVCAMDELFPGEVRYVVKLRERVGNRELIDPHDSRPTEAPATRARPTDTP
jgi:hypothetical protein